MLRSLVGSEMCIRDSHGVIVLQIPIIFVIKSTVPLCEIHRVCAIMDSLVSCACGVRNQTCFFLLVGAVKTFFSFVVTRTRSEQDTKSNRQHMNDELQALHNAAHILLLLIFCAFSFVCALRRALCDNRLVVGAALRCLQRSQTPYSRSLSHGHRFLALLVPYDLSDLE